MRLRLARGDHRGAERIAGEEPLQDGCCERRQLEEARAVLRIAVHEDRDRALRGLGIEVVTRDLVHRPAEMDEALRLAEDERAIDRDLGERRRGQRARSDGDGEVE